MFLLVQIPSPRTVSASPKRSCDDASSIAARFYSASTAANSIDIRRLWNRIRQQG